MRSRRAFVVALLCVSSLGCAAELQPLPTHRPPSTPEPTPPAFEIALAQSDATRAPAPPNDAKAAATAIDAFGIEMYRNLAGQGGNLVFSPASIAIALSMARAGARGETATQMDTVLHDLGSDADAPAINALDQSLASRTDTYPISEGPPQKVTLRIANAPFAQEGLKFEPAFLDALATRFGAGVRLVDYVGATEAARQQINGWVSDQTEQRIPELIAPDVLNVMTRLTLVNAIYLKAPWSSKFFDPSGTRDAQFTRLDGSSINVPMMSAHTGGFDSTDSFAYAEGTGWRALEIPYLGRSLAMDIIMPDDLAAFEAGLDADRFATITSAFEGREVILRLPTFGTETSTDLADMLGTMGMPLAFDPDLADFSGMTTQEKLYIGHVIHQANISVDEKGTEAAAATAVVMYMAAAPLETPPPPIILNVDHPFLIAIRDLPTGAILFMGRIVDPSKGT